jgi:hypothetical protein
MSLTFQEWERYQSKIERMLLKDASANAYRLSSYYIGSKDFTKRCFIRTNFAVLTFRNEETLRNSRDYPDLVVGSAIEKLVIIWGSIQEFERLSGLGRRFRDWKPVLKLSGQTEIWKIIRNWPWVPELEIFPGIENLVQIWPLSPKLWHLAHNSGPIPVIPELFRLFEIARNFPIFSSIWKNGFLKKRICEYPIRR